MLDHKKPFVLSEAPSLAFEARLPLADIAGYSAVVVLPSDTTTEHWQLRFDSELRAPTAGTALQQQLQVAFTDSLRSLNELQEEFDDSYDFHAKKADLQLGIGNIVGAIESAERALRIDAEKGGAFRLSGILIDEQRLEEAAAILRNRGDEMAYMEQLRLAQIAVLQGDLRAAQGIVEKAIGSDPNDYRGLMFMGTLHLGQGNFQLAVRYLRAAAAENEHSAKVHVNLAAAHLALRQESKAMHELRVASHIDGLDVNAVVLLSKLAVERNQYKDALYAVDRHYRAGGRSPEFLDRAAHLYFSYADDSGGDAGYYEKAREILRQLCDVDGAAAHWNNLGVIDDRAGRLEKATRMFSRSFQIAHEADEDFSLPLSNLLVEHVRSQNFEGVLRAADEFFASGGAFAQTSWGKIALQKAAALEGLNRRNEAAEFIESILKTHTPAFKDHRQMLSALAVHHASVTSDPDQLTAVLDQVAEFGDSFFDDTSDDEAARLRNNLAFAYLILTDTDHAVPYLAANRQRVGSDYYITATQGLYQICRGDVDEGKALYQQAISIAPNKTDKARIRQRMFYQLARYHESVGDITAARDSYAKSVKVKFAYNYLHDAAKRALARLPTD